MGFFIEKIAKLDYWLITKVKKWALPFARFAIFVVYFWSGLLKIFLVSPLNPLVSQFLIKTAPEIPLNNFIVVLGFFELIIALTIINHHLRHLALLFLTLHLLAVVTPLFILPDVTWQGFLIPTLEGRFIIDNILIIALAIVILGNLHPFLYKEKDTS